MWQGQILFRLCGLSKPITGAAVAYLLQEGKVIDQVFGPEMNKAFEAIEKWPTREIK